MADRLTVRACAKINLFLDVTARRDDDYHLLNSVMQQISLADRLTLTLDGVGGDVSLSTDHGTLRCDESNLICRAARAFFGALGESRSLTVHLEKEIPMAAGLGGGSADAAAVLHALNRLCGNPFAREKLCELGATLGADVPFCVLGGTARAEGIGELLTPLTPMPDTWIVVAMGQEQMPTPDAYRALDLRYHGFAARKPNDLAYRALIAALPGGPAQIGPQMYNIFEDAVLPVLPALAARMALLMRHGAYGARMSGSGAAVFGLFDGQRPAGAAAEALRAHGADVWLCRPEPGACE